MANLEEKIGEAIVEVGKETVSDLVRPTSKSIGDNIGLLVDGVMGWLGYWGKKQKIKREVYLEDYKKKITENILSIPEDHLIEPPMRIVGPAVEASKYFIEEAYCRDMFAKLIASSCDSSKTRFVHPVFPEIIKQLSPLDAKFLMLFKENRTYPVVELNEELKEGTVSPFSFLLFDLKDNKNRFDYPEQLELTKTVEILIRFGILKKNSAILELGVYKEEIFECNVNYLDFEQYGEDGWWDFGQSSPMELTIKHIRFEAQSEGRIIINTDRARIKELLKNPIEIGSIEDISQYCDQYFYDGIRVIIHADVVELPERHTAKQQGKISGMK